MSTNSLPGALVVSLDFELCWGMLDRGPIDQDTRELLRESRNSALDIARELASRSVRATWGTVGFLFASSREELEFFKPALRPNYARVELDPYLEPVGEDEEEDPVHLAGSIVAEISRLEGQEIGSHTFSHYYCLEPGQDQAAFEADLTAARAIAEHLGVPVRSLVMPRNQWNPDYGAVVRRCGFSCYRGPQPSWGYRRLESEHQHAARRAARLVDTYGGVVAPPTTAWEELEDSPGLCNVPASAFLRPFSPRLESLEPLRVSRIGRGLRLAARRSRIFHLWWHPHNFTRHPSENFDLLRRVLDDFDRQARSEGMRSLCMGDVPAEVSELSG